MSSQRSIDDANRAGGVLGRPLTARTALALGLAAMTSLTACPAADAPEDGAARSVDSERAEARRLTSAPGLDQLDQLDPAAVEAIQEAATVLRSDPENADSWTQLGILFHAHRRFDSAGTCYEQSLLRDPEVARNWYYRALVDEQLGATDRAEAALGRSIGIDASYPPAHWRLGLLQLGRGDLEGAETSMAAALAIAPQDAASVIGMARVRLQQGEGERAVELLEAHTARMPGDDNGRFLLGTAYRQVGRMDEAAEVLSTTAGADPIRSDPWQAEIIGHRLGYRAKFLAASEQLDRGQIQEAIASLRTLHEEQPEDTLVQLSLHRALRASGALDEAIGLLLATRERDPLHEMVHLHLAGAYLEKARRGGPPSDAALLRAALESSEQACTLAPSYANAHGMHGDILTESGQSEAATDAYLRAANLGPDSIMWHRLSARSLCMASRWEEALQVLARLDRLEPNSARTLYFIGVALGSTGKIDQAREALARAAQLAPEDQPIADAYSRVLNSLSADEAASDPDPQAQE